MATSNGQIAATTTKSTTVNSSLWFDSYSLLLTDLEHLSPSSDIPSSVVEKLKENHAWFLNTVNQFKPPCESSKNALNAEQVVIGSRKLSIKPQLKDLALKLSSTVLLDEVQSYILVERSVDHSALDGINQGFLNEIVLQYYTERQCLLKCLRQIIVHALNVDSAVEQGDVILDEVRKLVSDGFESKLIDILRSHFSSTFAQQMDTNYFILWAEDMLIEGNLVLDILFLAYYESFCSCSAAHWKELCLLYKDMTGETTNFMKLGVSTEACKYCDRAKIQMLLILIETLDFEGLLQMTHDEVPFSRNGSCMFTPSDVLDLDSIISNFDIFETKEAGPLILAWAVFLCLIVSLPEKEEFNELMEIDHVGYVRQAFESASLSHFLEILRSDVLKDSDGPVAGFRSILRTFMSAFVASYEINSQLVDDTFRLILAILSEIYRGEESLCIQFWDKRSIVDGPIRCLLFNVEGEFPCRTIELTRFLSALSEGCWPAECVYNFMEKSIGISSIVNMGSDTAEGASQIVETQLPLQVPGVEGLFIPSKTRGRILRMIDSKTAVVRWEYKQSGVLVLLLRLAQVLELDGSEEVVVILDLFSRLASFNMAVCFSLMNIGKPLLLQTNYDDSQMGSHICCTIDMVEILCNLVRSLSPCRASTFAMSMGISILAKMMKCSPSHVSKAVMKMNIFDLSLKTSIFSDQNDGFSSSASWLLSGRLAKLLLTDCEHNAGCPLAISVLDFTVQLIEAGVENEFTFALIVFCLQYVFVNHEYWKYKVKKDRWNVTQKVLEVLRRSIISSLQLKKIGGSIRDVILSDSSVHSMVFRIVCTTSPALEKLYTSRLYDWRDIDGLQQALCSMLEILFIIFSHSAEDDFSTLPIFYQAMLSSTTKPIPVVEALASLMSYSRYPAIQLRATEAFSMLCSIADRLQSCMFGITNLSLGGNQVIQLKHSIETIIGEQSEKNEELYVAVIKFLTSVANHQPVLLAGIFAGEEFRVVHKQTNESPCQNDVSENVLRLVDALLLFVERTDSLIERNAQALLGILGFLKALWEGAAQYSDILESIRKSKRFWKLLSESILLMPPEEAHITGNLSEADTLKVAFKYRCQSAALDILALELFLQKKLLYADSLFRRADKGLKDRSAGVDQTSKVASTSSRQIGDIFLIGSDSSALSNLLKSCAACTYDPNIYRDAKIAFGLLTAHLIGKLSTGDTGSLSVSLAEAIIALSTKLTNLPTFVDLCTQYTLRGYSEGTQIRSLILSDLYYHLQGELEGRSIEHGPFNELSQFLVESNLLQAYKRVDQDLKAVTKISNLFDILRLQDDTGLDVWDYSEWKASKKIAENTLFRFKLANSMLLHLGSRLPALRSLVTFITLNTENSFGRQESTLKKDYELQILSSIEPICKELQTTVGLFAATSDVPQEVFDFLAVQSELLLSLARYIGDNAPPSTCLVILKTCGFGLKGLRESRLMDTEVKHAIKFLLLLLQLVIGVCSQTDNEPETSGDVSNVCLGLLPLLCSYTEIPDQLVISLSTLDLIIKKLLTPSSWLPVIKQHLQLQLLILKLHDKTSFESLPVILKFFLTLASVRGGGEMILGSGFLSSLRVLITEISDDGVSDWVRTEKSTMPGGEIEKPRFIWELGLAVLVAIICSLGETSQCADVVDSTISFFFSEKAHLIAYHLSVPEIPSDNHDKKRARAQKRQTSLYALRETEHTLMLICVLAKHRNSWVKAIKEMGSELRQNIIHLLAFISRRSHLFLESSTRAAPFLCVPLAKEDIDYCQKPSFVNSRSGWFSIAALACMPIGNATNEVMSTAIVVKDPVNRQAEPVKPTCFSDIVAIQLYRIAFLVLKFLCLQADDALRRAEELGSVDLSHFPELPDPEILHGLQDQAVAIATEVCEANKLKSMDVDAQDVCLLMLKILEMALHLEFCVSQICGIRPVMGRVEEFSKQMRLLARATEGQTFLKSSMKHLKQIVSFMYPGLLQSEGIL
ncbi:uncharacterized protein LOC141648320 isoform X2 [Silene latifolia]|uniref:uncharacterized protein LOC141648320 isoform X2 n=1 Tax=Silene latifolia TaxID=37657 RepID=UPI003D785F2F